MRSRFLLIAATVSACGRTDRTNSVADSTGTNAAPPPSATAADVDRPTAGGGVPSGYSGRTDRPNTPISGARYVISGNTWYIHTGPAHIVYAAKDLASGSYSVSSTLEQLQKPAHPEAFGVFIGGTNLDQPNQAYTYFLVRGTGEVLVKVREGEATRDVVKWTPVAGVPKQDASGRATYKFDVHVTTDSVRLMVNGKQVAAASKVGLPTDGIAGLRINHNLHVKATPVAITRS